jgi:hypothetical protein
MPAAAAVAVALVIGGAAVVPRLLAQGLASAPKPHPAHGVRPEPGTPRAATPPVFAALPANGRAVQIQSAVTGRILAQLAPPHGSYFAGAAVANDGRTVLLALRITSGGGCITRVDRVRLSAACKPGQLEPSGIPDIQGVLPSRSFTVTPDGSTLAFVAYFLRYHGQCRD